MNEILNYIKKELFERTVLGAINELDDIISHPGETKEERANRRKREKRERKEKERREKLKQLDFERNQRRIKWERKLREMQNIEYWGKKIYKILLVILAIGIAGLFCATGNGFVTIVGLILTCVIISYSVCV